MATTLAPEAISKNEHDPARGFYNCPETPEPVSLKVIGDFPIWISGVLYRTGPGTYSVPRKNGQGTFEIRHWFDGLSLHHRFDISNGTVSYRSRNAASARIEYVSKTGVIPAEGGSFGQEDPCSSILGKFFCPQRQNVSVTITPHFRGFAAEYDPSGNTLVTRSDYNAIQVLDRVTLEPLAIRSYGEIHPELDGPLAASHAGVGDVEFYNYSLSFGRTPVYKIFKIDVDGKAHILTKITDAPSAYLHSVSLMKKHFVLAVWQSDYKQHGLPLVASKSLSVNTFLPWSDDRKALFYVVDRNEGYIVGRYEAPTFFAFHIINAYDDDDDDGSVVLDLPAFKDNSIIEKLTLESLRGDKPLMSTTDATPRRFRLPGGVADAKKFAPVEAEFDLGDSFNIELPVVAPSVANTKHRYAYGIHWAPNEKIAAGLANSLIKIDYEKKEKTVWRGGMSVPGEPIFVGRPGGEGEDDGVLLTVALDAERGLGALVVIDARTMREVARAEMDVPFPSGFHGAFEETR